MFLPLDFNYSILLVVHFGRFTNVEQLHSIADDDVVVLAEGSFGMITLMGKKKLKLTRIKKLISS